MRVRAGRSVLPGPLLGVLPGTGGLTRLVDKRKVRRDVADLFCTKAEGFRARDAVKYRLIDASFPRSKWEDEVSRRAKADAARPPAATRGVQLPEIVSELSDRSPRSRRASRMTARRRALATAVSLRVGLTPASSRTHC